MGTWLPALITGAFTVVVAFIEVRSARERKKDKDEREKTTKEREHSEAIDKGLLALLRYRIIDQYNHYMEQKYIPIYGIENIMSMYGAYHALGGNGTITALVKTLRELPTDPPEE